MTDGSKDKRPLAVEKREAVKTSSLEPKGPGQEEVSLSQKIDLKQDPDQALAAIAGEKEAKVSFNLSDFNDQMEAMAADIFNPEVADEKILEKYRHSRQEVKKDLDQLYRQKEQFFLLNEFLTLNPKAEIVDADKGIYAISLTSGEKIYGSLYSIVDANEALGDFAPLAQDIQSGQGVETNTGNLMAIRVKEGEGYKSVIQASGSFAQKEVVKYPADADFAEHLEITAAGKTEAAQQLADLVTDTIAKTDQNPQLRFTELKIGVYPDNLADEERRGKGINWNSDEVKAGQKQISLADGSTRVITLAQAAQNPGMVKINWLGNLDAYQGVTEVTKVINVSAVDTEGNSLFTNSMKGSAFQEAYFGSPEGFGLTQAIQDSEVYWNYINFLKGDIKKYSGQDHPNFMKVAKRAYNLFKLRGEIGQARELSELLNSPYGELAARTDQLGMLGEAVAKGLDFKCTDVVDQLDVFEAVFRPGGVELTVEEKQLVEANINKARARLTEKDTLAEVTAQEFADLLKPVIELSMGKVNLRAEQFLKAKPFLQKYLT